MSSRSAEDHRFCDISTHVRQEVLRRPPCARSGEQLTRCKSHAHWLEKLRDVRDVLRGCPSHAMDGQLTSTRFVLDSFMQLLGLEDDAETVPAKDDFLPDHLKTKTKGKPMHERPLDDFSIRSDLDEDSDDVEIAAWFLFQDMQQMRDYVKETWLDYTEGRTTLVTASFLATQAVVIVKEMENEFFDAFSSRFEHRTYADLMATMFPDVDSSFDKFYPFLKSLPNTTQNFLMAMTWARVFYYGKTIVKDVYRAPLPGSIVEFDPTADTSGWTEERLRVERDGLLVKHLAEVHFQALQSDGPSGKQCIDENALVGDFRAFLNDREHAVPLHLVFQWQIWQDHVVINRQCLQRSLDQLKEVTKNVVNAARHWLQKGFNPELYTDNYVGESKKEVETYLIEQLPKIVFDDKLGDQKRRDGMRTVIVPFQIFLYNPWGCGIAISKILCLTQHICTDIINGTGLFTSTLQLYDALLQHGKIKHWPLMDHLLEISAPVMYYAGRPKPGTFLIAHDIANGGDPARMSGRKDPNYRYDGHGTGALRPGGTWLERIMEKQKYVLTDKDIEELFPRPEDQKQVIKPAGRAHASGSRPRFGVKRCDPFTLLRALKDRVAREFEDSGVGVDFFTIQMFSSYVLQQWNRRAWAYFVEFYGEGYMERPSQVAFLVGYLFMGLEHRQKIAQRGRVISEDSVNKMFNEAATAFQKAREDVERGIVKGGSITYFGERDHGAFWNEFRTA
ncbi:hypothetical protein BDZ89DRAFT_202755 [Hymenopellis radicata]|nr:hypothetical protein BDZ89DRAFT_202755 [Hymenopellis radicata]